MPSKSAAARVMSSPTLTLPQKRKVAPAEGDFPPGTFDVAEGKTDGADDTKGEYESGRVICEGCGEGISFRDEATGGFTVKHWDAHRLECASTTNQTPETLQFASENQSDAGQASGKRRRAKRTEEERIDYLRSDPYVAQFEAYRVLCASCDKWIRLRPNSTYCSIPWDAHRKSCLAKRLAKNAYPTDDRNTVLSADPYVRKFDAERVLCKVCEQWIPLGSEDHAQAMKNWNDHRAACQQDSTATPSASNGNIHIPTADSVPPPPKHLLALASSSSFPIIAPAPSGTRTAPVVQQTSPIIPGTAFKDLTPTNFPSHESRRRNAEQRAASLRADPFVGDVEPNRVFCQLCQKWVQLRQDSSYCAYPWLQHRGKCLKRHQKRTQKEAELAELRAQREAALEVEQMMLDELQDDSDEPESEEGVESGDEEEKMRRREQRREERKKAKQAARAEAMNARLKAEEERKVREQKLRASISDDDEDMDGEDHMDVDPIRSCKMADLVTPSGRLDFVFRSVRHLFKSTYDGTDKLTIAALVTFLNAAMPPDKHEDFDTAEVTKAVKTLHDMGEFILQGDVLRAAK
ncbi:hypothetical protein CERSUDRAFT_112800 [Gelatoporia subvermispora B]|uniref:Uncharacterized protein n=1 Tax=Ceriporiopsis subvermispora (strain B) TaxID=914234 RepID=M2RKV5_CERS8|nr:hypothetical protein CERSUDRAFT_112800 [Gelatoporia subvermispora B]